MRLLAVVVLAGAAWGADVCPVPRFGTVEGVRSASERVGKKRCVWNEVVNPAAASVEWPAAGIERVVAERVEVAVCCFRRESAQREMVRVGDREVAVQTHREDPKAAGKEDEDEFPDLIEDDAHGREVSIRGVLGDGVKVDVLLRCTASKFADQFAFQFTVMNKSDKGVEVDWDHLRQVRASASPSMQPVAGGMGYVFLTAKRPKEAVAAVELRRSGTVLGRFRFDGFTLEK